MIEHRRWHFNMNNLLSSILYNYISDQARLKHHGADSLLGLKSIRVIVKN